MINDGYPTGQCDTSQIKTTFTVPSTISSYCQTNTYLQYNRYTNSDSCTLDILNNKNGVPPNVPCTTSLQSNVTPIILDNDNSYKTTNILNPTTLKLGYPTTSCYTKQAEVFHVGGYNKTQSQVSSICQTFGAQAATVDQVNQAYKDGAEWCSWGHTSTDPVYPMQHGNTPGCNGSAGPVLARMNNFNASSTSNWNSGLYGVNCFGVKPDQGSALASNASNLVLPFNGNQWNSPRATNLSTYTSASIPSTVTNFCNDVTNRTTVNYVDTDSCIRDIMNNKGGVTPIINVPKTTTYTLGYASASYSTQNFVLGTITSNGTLTGMTFNGYVYDQNWGNYCANYIFGILRNNNWVIYQNNNTPRPGATMNHTMTIPANTTVQNGDQIVVQLGGWWPGCASYAQNITIGVTIL